MIAFHLEYSLDPEMVDVFQEYAQAFVELTKKYGGEHYGYFINAEKEQTTALAVFAFQTVENYNVYRTKVLHEPEYESAMALAKKTRCIKCCHRTIYDRKVA